MKFNTFSFVKDDVVADFQRRVQGRCPTSHPQSECDERAFGAFTRIKKNNAKCRIREKMDQRTQAPQSRALNFDGGV